MNYFLIIFIPTILYMLEDIIKTKPRIFEKLGIAFIVIMASIRYGFGADYFTYHDAFYRISDGIMVDNFEAGYIILNKVIGYFGLNFNFLLGVIAVFNYTLLYLTLKRNKSKHRWLAIFLYLSYFDMFFYSLSAVRQSIAVSIFIYSIKYISKNKFSKYLMCIMFAQLFHRTAFILIPIYFLYHIYKKINYSQRIIFMISSLMGYTLLIKGLPLLSRYMNDRLVYYLFLDGSENISSNNLAAIILVAVVTVWMYYSYKIKDTKYESNDYDFCLFSITIFLLLKCMQYIHYYGFIPRLQMYFYALYIFAVPRVIDSLDKKWRHIIIVFLVVFMSLNFILRYQEVTQYAGEFYAKYNTIFNFK